MMKNLLAFLIIFFYSFSCFSQTPMLERVYPFERYGDISILKILPNGIGYAMVEENSILKTTDAGLTWGTEILIGEPKQEYFFSLEFFDESNPDKYIIAGRRKLMITESGGQDFRDITPTDIGSSTFWSAELTSAGRIILGTGEGIYYSDDEGSNWSAAISSKWWRVTHLAENASFFATNTGVFRSTDNGTTVDSIFALSQQPRYITSFGNNIWVQTSGELFFSSDNGMTWGQKQGDGMASGNGLEAIDANTIFTVTNNRIWWTRDGGDNWSDEQFFSNNFSGFGRFFLDSKGGIWIGGESKRILYAPGLEQPFQKRGPGKYQDLRTITGEGKEIWAVGQFGVLMYSGDSGDTWTEYDLGNEDLDIWKIIKTPNRVLLFENEGEVFEFKSDGSLDLVTDLGGSFALFAGISPDKKFVYAFLGENQNTEIIRSSDEGTTWESIYTHSASLSSMHFFENGNLGTYTREGEIYYSFDNGTTWDLQAEVGEMLFGGILMDEDRGIFFQRTRHFTTTDGWQNIEEVTGPGNIRNILREGRTDKMWGFGNNGTDTWVYEKKDFERAFGSLGSPGSVQNCSGYWYDSETGNIWLAGEGLNLEVIRKAPSFSGDLENSALEIEIFPNPTNGTMFLKSESKIEGFEIFNATGSLLQSGKLDFDAEISIEGYPNGLYFLRLESAGHSQVKKIIKN